MGLGQGGVGQGGAGRDAAWLTSLYIPAALLSYFICRCCEVLRIFSVVVSVGSGARSPQGHWQLPVLTTGRTRVKRAVSLKISSLTSRRGQLWT